MNNPLTCTILPTYNERDNIRPLIMGLLENAITPHVILVIDDDSPDDTWHVVEEVAKHYNSGEEIKVALIRRMEKKGLTSAIQCGIDEALHTYHADIITWMDCDLSMPPQDVSRLVRSIMHHGADVAVGSRWVPGGDDRAHDLMARTLSWIINYFATLLLGCQVHDWTSGFIASRSHVFQQIRLRGDYGEYCIDLLGQVVKQGFYVQEVPYVCVPRTSGKSKTGANLWDYLVKGRKYITTIWRSYNDL